MTYPYTPVARAPWGGSVDAQGFELKRLRLHDLGASSITTAWGATPKDGALGYSSDAGDKRPYFYDTTTGTDIPWLRNDAAYNENIAGQWSFTRVTGTSPFNVTSTTRVENLNTHYIADANDSNTGRAGSSAATVSTAAIRDANGRILAVAPSGAVDAELVTYGFLYSFVSGVRDPKQAAKAVFDGDFNAAHPYTFDAGGQTITVNANGVVAFDSVTVAVNDRVGLVNETGANRPYGGLYIVTQVGTAGQPLILQRAADADASAEVTNGLQFWVTEGSVYGSSGWLLTTADPITLNTTNLTFVQNNGATGITAGNGIDKTGNTISVKVNASTTYVANAILFHGSTSTISSNANLSWNGSLLSITGALTVSGNTTFSGLTSGRVPRASTAGLLVDGTIRDDGTKVGVGADSPVDKLDVTGGIRVSTAAFSAPTGGVGLELSYRTADDAGFITSYSRTAAAYKPLTIAGSSIVLTQGNIGFNTSTFGTSLAKGICIGSGTAPTTSPADAVQMWVADRGGTAGKASLHGRAEDGTLFVLGDRFGFGTVTPSAAFEVITANNGQVVYSDSVTDASQKNLRMGLRHYTNAEENVSIIGAYSTETANFIVIGGGTVLQNAATSIDFYTAATPTTTTGTLRWSVTSAGILQSNGAQTIQASGTGAALTFATTSNGNILLSPNGTGIVQSAKNIKFTAASAYLYHTNGEILAGADASGFYFANGATPQALPIAFGSASTTTVTINSTSTRLSYLTQKSVLFAGASGAVSQDNANFQYDSANAGFGVGIETHSTVALRVRRTGAKTAEQTAMVATNEATSSTGSIAKYVLWVNSTGTWNGASAVNHGIYINAVSGGTTNWALYNNTAADVYLGSGKIGNATSPHSASTFDFRFAANGTAGLYLGDATNGWAIVEDAAANLIFRDTNSGVVNANLLVLSESSRVGILTISPTYDLSFGGNAARTVGLERHTTADTAGSAFTIAAGGATSGATNKAGGTLFLRAGQNTGSGGSTIEFYTCAAGGAATTDGTSTLRMSINTAGAVNVASLTASQLVFTDSSKNLVSGTNIPAGTTIGSVAICRKVSGDIGDGAASSFSITHSLNSLYVTVEVFEKANGVTWANIEITRTTVNALTIAFDFIPASNEFGYTITG